MTNVPLGDWVRSLAEEETVLPCVYKRTQEEVVVQVTWMKKKSDGTKEQIILAHHISGQTAFGTWSRRVRFKNSDPTVDSSLVITTTELTDEGSYICQISTYPLGNFDKEMWLTVWTIPISSLEPTVLVEGLYSVAATCRSTALPTPNLSWDTELTGQSTNRTYDNGVVTSQYSLYPLRSMNGKRLDCLVWHKSFKAPRRIPNSLVVHYPPVAEVTGYKDEWHTGLENAALKCTSGGNPTPNNFTWFRVGEDLPEGVILQPDGTLFFGRPLSKSDAGTYQCVAKNTVGTGKVEVEVTVREVVITGITFQNLLMAGAGGLLIFMLIVVISVTCHHKRRNKKLKRELTEKKVEISTLARQASIRRMNSVSTDARGATEENIPLRVEGTLRTSLSSLGEQAYCRDSHSTISARGGGGGGAVDYLGRPVLHNNSRRGRLLERDEESRLRVENYVRNSTMSLETRYQPPLLPTSYPVQTTEVVRQINGSLMVPMEGGSRPGSVIKTNHVLPPISSPYPPVTDDEDEVDEGLGGPASQEHPEDQDSETNSSQVSYPLSNGSLRPKIRPLTPIVSPHASLIHKAQIV